MEILKEEIKSVVFEKHDLENRDESISYNFLAFLDYRDSNAETRLFSEQNALENE